MSDRGRGGRGGPRGGRGDYRGGRGGGGSHDGGRGGRGGRGGGGYDRSGGGYDRGGGGYDRGGGGYDRGGGGYDRGGGGYDRGGGRGGYRGGRGGGSFGEGDRDDVFKLPSGSIPQPSAAVTKLEDEFIRDALDPISKVVKISVDGSKDVFPYRPGFGVHGTRITLWANYFTIDVKLPPLTKYSIQVAFVPSDDFIQSGATPKEAKGIKLARIIEQALKELCPPSSYATDFKAQVITLKKLSLGANHMHYLTLSDPGRRREEKWSIQFSPAPLRMDALVSYLQNMRDAPGESAVPKFPDEIDAMGIILGHTARADPNVCAVGKGRFFATDGRVDQVITSDSQKLAILRGYFQSVRPVTGRLLLNANVTHGVFKHAQPVADLFNALRLNCLDRIPNSQTESMVMRELKKVHRFLSKTRIMCRILVPQERTSRIVERAIAGIARRGDGNKEEHPIKLTREFGGPADVAFYYQPYGDGKPPANGLQYNTYVTVEQYFKATYGYTTPKGLPLVNVGTPGRPRYVPAELCKIMPGQPIKTKLSARDQDDMIKFACRSPPANAKSITEHGRKILALDQNPLLTAFGVSVDRNLVTVQARELKPPAIVYKNGSSFETVRPDHGAWLMKNVRIAKPGRAITSWTFVVINKAGAQPVDPGLIADTMGKFGSFMERNMGIKISGRPAPPTGITGVFRGAESDLSRLIREAKNIKTRPQLVIVVLPEKSTPIYNMVKKIADVDEGIHTVCVVKNKVLDGKGQFGYFANVALKVNLKFGGVNHKLSQDLHLFQSGKTMVVGYDVTHPTNLGVGAPKKDTLPSIVGLVASIDKDLGQWPATAWNNPSSQESLDEQFVARFASRLDLWRKNNAGQLPENVLIFRDGVSEGQFQMVLEQELPFIRQACQTRYQGAKPPRLTLVVSVKRHQTRFFPTDPAHIHPRSKSPKEGTIVDRGVTNVRYWDFFLQAHASMQGTARAAHYTVLLDEIFRQDYGADAANVLEKVTHDMCYLYGRATKAVSICPPAYYADLVCGRARVHKNELFEDFSDTASQVSQMTDNIRSRQVHTNLMDSMYYI